MKNQVFLLDSGSETVVKVNAPLLLAGLERPVEYLSIQKALAEPKSSGSKKLREKYGITLDGVMCATRPFDFSLYAYAATLNTYHMRAIRAKSKDIVGRKWSITGEGRAGVKDRIEAFFKGAFGKLTFGEGMEQVWGDYESLGNGFLEIVPTVAGDEPAELAHVPATEMWVRLDGMGFVQQKNGEYSHFRDWGVPKKAFDSLPPNDPLLKEGVTSVCFFSRYFSCSPYYGIPCIMPAWNRLALAVLESEFNLGFFNNNAIPDYAVILEGDWADDADETIKTYFRQHIKGQAHKTMVLPVAEGRKIHFEQLTSDNAKEGAFRLLRADCRDEILHAHGVPPQKVGIVETGRLGGNAANEQIEEYKISVVEPGREKVCARLNRLIELGFETSDFKIEFGPYSTDDKKQDADIDCAYLDRKVLVPNEVRKKRYPDYEPLPGGDEPLDQAGDAATAALGEMQQTLKKAMAPHLL